MIPITRPDGTVTQMNPATFAQFYYEDHRAPQSGTRIDLNSGFQITPERSEDLAARLHGLVRLVMFHIPAARTEPSFPIWINVASIRSVRDTPPGTTISATRAPLAVVENYATVMQMINAASGASPLSARLSATLASDPGLAAKAKPASRKRKSRGKKVRRGRKGAS
jgi:hypothetical protein